jgi:hypothetical protein
VVGQAATVPGELAVGRAEAWPDGWELVPGVPAVQPAAASATHATAASKPLPGVFLLGGGATDEW